MCYACFQPNVRTRFFVVAILLLSLIQATPLSANEIEGRDIQCSVNEVNNGFDVCVPDVIIEQILVSPNNLVANETSDNMYGAVDWNGDGEYGKYSDQYIMLTNNATEAIDISDWMEY